MDAAAGGAADQQRRLACTEIVIALHLGSDMLHFFEARRDQPGQADDVGALGFGAGQNVLAGHHHAHIDDFEVIALQHHGDDVLADVMHIALDRGDDDLALRFGLAASGDQRSFFGFDIGQQMGHRLFHHARAFHHLRQEHLAGTEAVADDVHAGHQRAFDHMQRPPALGLYGLPGFFGVGGDEFGDAMYQRMAEALVDIAGAPGQPCRVVDRHALGALGHFDQALARVGAAVQHHIFDALTQLGVEVVIDANHAGIDDAHVHAGLDRVVQEHGVDGLAYRVVAAETERHVRDSARDLGARQVLLDPASCLDEVDRVVVVFFDAGGDGENVRVEDDVFGRKADLVDQDAVGARADFNLALIGVSLAFFVESHHHRGGAIAAHQLGLAFELGLAFLHRNRVDDALALDAFQTGFDDAPFRAVDHDRNARDLGLAGEQIQEAHHRRLAVEHRLVHIDVDDLGAVLDLLARNGQGRFELAVQDQPGKGLGAGDIGALADIDEQTACTDLHRFKPGQLHGLHGSEYFRHGGLNE